MPTMFPLNFSCFHDPRQMLKDENSFRQKMEHDAKVNKQKKELHSHAKRKENFYVLRAHKCIPKEED